MEALEQAPDKDRWLFSYADFVTLLFAVFVVLFAVAWQRSPSLGSVSNAIHSGFDSLGAVAETPATSPSNAKPDQAPTTVPDDSALYQKLHAILGDSISRQEVVMQRTPEGLVISLHDLGLFPSGQANLLPGAGEKLRETGKILFAEGMELRVEGHSDDQPIHNALYRSNWELSTARAMSVLNLLVDQAGFPPDRISAAGYGPFRPIAPNDTPEGRQKNRRIDLIVLTPTHHP
jgi:chemotaxis protein MotB